MQHNCFSMLVYRMGREVLAWVRKATHLSNSVPQRNFCLTSVPAAGGPNCQDLFLAVGFGAAYLDDDICSGEKSTVIVRQRQRLSSFCLIRDVL